MNDDRANERAALSAAIASGAMIAQQVAGRATRDALFLSNFPAVHVPKVMVAGAAMSIAAVFLLSGALLRFSPARVVPATFAVSSALLVLEWALALRAPAAAAIVLYLHAAVFGATLISAFWSLVNERFDPHTARRSMGRIASGGTLGGLIGGLFAWRAGRVMGAPAMILALATASAVSAWMTLRLGAELPRRPAGGVAGKEARDGAGAEARDGAGAGSGASGPGLAALLRRGHLRDLALLVGLGAVSGALFDVALSAEAAAAMTDRGDLLSFFSLFHLAVSLLSFAVQSIGATLALDRLGLAGTVGILPAAVLASTLSIVAAPRLWAAAIVRGTDAVLRNSLFRSGYELLYTPLPPDQKRSVKTLIDVGSDRIGTAAGSGLAMLVLLISSDHSATVLLGLGAVITGATLFFTPRLHRGYVAALEVSLRTGAVSLDPAHIMDATTRRTLSGAVDALSRDKVRAEIAALRKGTPSRSEPERGNPAEGERGPSPNPGEPNRNLGGSPSSPNPGEPNRNLGGSPSNPNPGEAGPSLNLGRSLNLGEAGPTLNPGGVAPVPTHDPGECAEAEASLNPGGLRLGEAAVDPGEPNPGEPRPGPQVNPGASSPPHAGPGPCSAVGSDRALNVGAPPAPLPADVVAPADALKLFPSAASDPFLQAVADLRSADPARVRRVLARPLDPALIAHVIPLLALDGLVSDAIRALRAVAPRATGQLLDALHDPSLPLSIRRRIPRVLQACPTQRAADGLMLGLADERFELRYQCGVALARLLQQRAPIHLRRDDVIAAAQREIEADRHLWDAQLPGSAHRVGAPSEASQVERLLVERTIRGLEHIFRVLSLTLDREPLEIAYRALYADDQHLRGTALEYLENVLPERIRERLWPYLGAVPSATAAQRRSAELALDELRRSAASIPRAPVSVRRRREPRT